MAQWTRFTAVTVPTGLTLIQSREGTETTGSTTKLPSPPLHYATVVPYDSGNPLHQPSLPVRRAPPTNPRRRRQRPPARSSLS